MFHNRIVDEFDNDSVASLCLGEPNPATHRIVTQHSTVAPCDVLPLAIPNHIDLPAPTAAGHHIETHKHTETPQTQNPKQSTTTTKHDKLPSTSKPAFPS